MIEVHKYLKVADGDTVIWHYMPIRHFLTLLNSKHLYFSRVDHLDDKAEVLVSDAERQYWKKVLKIDLGSWVESERKRVFVNCWIKSKMENSVMWSAFASQGNGVAIKTTVDKLIRSYQGDKHVNILDVNYIDHRLQPIQPPDGPINVLRFFSTKRIFYEPEQELRLIYESSKVDEYDFFQIPIDINVLIEELRVGPNTEEDVLDMLRIMVPVKGGSFPVVRSELFYP